MTEFQNPPFPCPLIKPTTNAPVFGGAKTNTPIQKIANNATETNSSKDANANLECIGPAVAEIT